MWIEICVKMIDYHVENHELPKKNLDTSSLIEKSLRCLYLLFNMIKDQQNHRKVNDSTLLTRHIYT